MGVTRYNVHRSTTAGFAPSAANRIAQPIGTSHTDSGLATGTYHYVVIAEDAAGNLSTPTSELTAAIADASAPTAPSALAANATGTTIALSWTAATDNIGVTRYNVHRGTTTGFTPSAANRIAQPTGLAYSDVGLAPGAYFYKVTAEDAAGNIGPVSNTATATIADGVAPSTPASLTATGGPGQAALSWPASTDNVAVSRYNVHRSTVAGLIPSTANRVAQPTGTTYTDNVAAGTYFYKVVAEDAAGNLSGPSPEAVANVTAPVLTGLVAAYGFDAGSGTTAVDQSGSGNNGTLTNATWAGAAAGKFGNALSFNGTNALVTVADSNSLDLTKNGMTIEAWVKPASVGGFDSRDREGTPRRPRVRPLQQLRLGPPAVAGHRRFIRVFSTAPQRSPIGCLDAPAPRPSTGRRSGYHVTARRSRRSPSAGSILTSTSPVKIGGNSIWSEWFDGLYRRCPHLPPCAYAQRRSRRT